MTQTVEAWQSAATPYGVDLAANSAGLVPGRLVRYLAGAMTTSERCWLRPISLGGGDAPNPADLMPLRHGDRFVGRLSGIRSVLGVTRPVYLVQTAREPCRKFAARASGTLDAAASPLAFDLDTLEFDSGAIAELTASGDILSHVEGEVELRYKVMADRLDTAGGASHYECYVQQSNDDGFSWSEVPDSRTGQICRHSTGGTSSVTAPAIQATSQNGTRFRLILLGVAGPTEVRTRSHQCQLFLTPCGGASTISTSYQLVAAWTPSATPNADEASHVTSEWVLADHGAIGRGTGDEETHSWDFDATDDYLSLTARPLDTDADFTVRVHFKLLAHPTVFQPFPLFLQHETGDAATRDALLQIYKQASDANSEIAAGVHRTGGPAAPFLVNSIALDTWYTVYLRWDAAAGQADISLVGGAAASAITSGDKVDIISPTVALAGSPDWSDSYGDIEIDSLRLWHRRLADYELV